MKLKYYFIFTEIINNKYKCTYKCMCVKGSYTLGLKMLLQKPRHDKSPLEWLVEEVRIISQTIETIDVVFGCLSEI